LCLLCSFRAAEDQNGRIKHGEEHVMGGEIERGGGGGDYVSPNSRRNSIGKFLVEKGVVAVRGDLHKPLTTVALIPSQANDCFDIFRVVPILNLKLLLTLIRERGGGEGSHRVAMRPSCLEWSA
jgi:hypothetical protein